MKLMTKVDFYKTNKAYCEYFCRCGKLHRIFRKNYVSIITADILHVKRKRTQSLKCTSLILIPDQWRIKSE